MNAKAGGNKESSFEFLFQPGMRVTAAFWWHAPFAHLPDSRAGGRSEQAAG